MIIGTRGSDLALVQSQAVAAALSACGHHPTLQIIVTQGDRQTHLSLDKLEGKGFFTTEIEASLRSGRIDLAVHSLKDLPADDAPGLRVASIPSRASCADVLIVRPQVHAPAAATLPLTHGARVGTSAIRRKAQLAAMRPDLTLVDLRGNVPTRLARLREGRCDAIVLAQAGISRLQSPLDDLVVVPLAPTVFVPAPGQGALALQCRENDTRMLAALEALHDSQGAELVAAERLLLRLLEAGCHVPLGAHARFVDKTIVMTVFFGGDYHATRLEQRQAHFFTVSGVDASEVAQKAWRRLGAPQGLHDNASAGSTAVSAGSSQSP